MGFIDLLKHPRSRFADEPDSPNNESRTAFLADKEPAGACKHHRVIPATRSLYWTMYSFMLATILLLSITVYQHRRLKGTEPTMFWSQEILGKGAMRPHKFSNGYNHSLGDTPEIRALYNTYFLEEEIGVPVADPAKYGLGTGYPSKKDKSVQVYIPSFIHQFHCIILFREAWWDLRDMYENRICARGESEGEKPETRMQKWNHVEHCMDYLRQMIKCNADTTLETPAYHEDGQISNTDGTDTWRQCYDMDNVWERYMEYKAEFNMVRPYSQRKGGM